MVKRGVKKKNDGKVRRNNVPVRADTNAKLMEIADRFRLSKTTAIELAVNWLGNAPETVQALIFDRIPPPLMVPAVETAKKYLDEIVSKGMGTPYIKK